MEKKAVTAKGHSAAEPQPKKNSPKRAHTVTKLRIRKRIFTAENAKGRKEDVAGRPVGRRAFARRMENLRQVRNLSSIKT